VGPDVGETWENSEFGAVQSREKVSTRSTLINSVTRCVLDGIPFGNDPDVIILRDENQSLSKNQRSLLCEINSNLGSLVFCSDPPSLFRDWQKEQFGKVVQIQSDRRANIIDSIRLVENNYLVTFVTENKTLILNPSSI
jgi:thymidine kinase